MQRQLDEQTIHRPTKFANFVVKVDDVGKAIEWYGKVLGTEIVFSDDNISFLTYDDEHHRIALIPAGSSDRVPEGPGVHHVAYTLGSLGELLATFRRLARLGIMPVLPINHGVTTSIYYEGPAGCNVEFQVDNYATPEELRAFMQSDAFAANPLGVLFDPEALAVRYENRDPVEELLLPGSA